MRATSWSGTHLKRASTSVSRVSTHVGLIWSSRDKGAEAGATVEVNEAPLSPISTVPHFTTSPPGSPGVPASYVEHPAAALSSSSLGSLSMIQSDAGDSRPDTPSGSNRRFASAVRHVMMMRSMPFGIPRKQATVNSTVSEASGRGKTADAIALPTTRIATLIPLLKSLEPTRDLEPHSALVRHLQFSPDGKYLATCRYVDVKRSYTSLYDECASDL